MHRFFPNWIRLKRLGNSRIIKTSYFWLVFVPIAAKVLEPIPDELTVHLFGAEVTLALALPFSWKVMYMMAVFFSIGQAFFALYCPHIIKDYYDYREFRNRHPGSGLFASHYEDVIYSQHLGIANANFVHTSVCHAFENRNDLFDTKVLNDFRHLSESDWTSVRTPKDVSRATADAFRAVVGEDDLCDDLFTLIQEFYGTKFRAARFFSATSFALGALCSAWLLIDSFLSVNPWLLQFFAG